MRISRVLTVLMGVWLLVGCASGPRNLYYWGDFPDANYAWLQDEPQNDEKLLETLEKNAQRAVANNHNVPPGFHAHLGLIYLKLGQIDQAVAHLQAEKAAFPEAAPFMDFQLRNLVGEKTP